MARRTGPEGALGGIGLAGLALLSACLPHGALGGAGRLEARVYDVELADDLGLACTAQLSLHFAEEFSDSSLGWLACLHAPGSSPVASECVELRAFPTGQVLELRGLADAPALARLDLVWPILSPAIERGTVFASWPLFAGVRQPVRAVARGSWARGQGGWSWTARVEDNDPDLQLDGTVTARIEVGPGGLEWGEWLSLRSACVDADCVAWSSRGSMRAAGVLPALPAAEVERRVEALAARRPGSTSAAAYLGLLRNSGEPGLGGCPAGRPSD